MAVVSSTAARSGTGGAVAFVLGAVVGAAVAYPALPSVGGFEPGQVWQDPGTTGSVLLVGALAVLVLPIVMMVLYQAFALLDR